MNRRSFFKLVTGFVAGIFATSVEGKKFSTEDFGGWEARKVSQDIYGDPNKLHCRSNMFYKDVQFGESFAGKIVSMTTFQGDLWIATEKRVYRIKDKEFS